MYNKYLYCTKIKMKREEIIQELKELSDAKYREFNKKLCPKTEGILGVRIPVLREYAKKLLKKYEYSQIIKTLEHIYFEEIMLKGMLIGLNKNLEIAEVKKEIKKFVPEIENWAVCDTFCSGLKITKKYKNEIWNLINDYLNSDKEFEIRFAVVMILDYFIEEQYLEEIYEICNHIKNDGYYAKMAVAWCVSICLVKYFEKTLEYLQKCNLDEFTYKKSIQKAIESYRLTKEQKEILKSMK